MSLFNIGLSGLNVAQNALSTVGHNFANAATPGYTRQNTIIASAGGQYLSTGFYGQGSNTLSVQRVYDSFLTNQLRGATAASAQLSTYSDQISQIDDLLADQKGGLAPLMQSFFKNVQLVSDTPADPAARQGLLSAAQALAGQIKSASDYFKQLQDGVNTQVSTTVDQINVYTKQIAKLNTEITRMTAQGNGQPPNDLLDQRDQAVSQLSQLIGVKVTVQDGGTSYNVLTGNGQPLVIGSDSYDMKAVKSASDGSRTEVAYTLPNGSIQEVDEGTLTGGSLSGLLQYRSETLDGAQSAIGRISLALGQTFNDQHKLGIDLNGNIGTDMFALGTATIYSNTRNTGTATATAQITNVGNLTTSDYTLRFDGTNYTLLRKSDNKVVATQAGPGAATITADGFSVQLTAGMAANDSFEIQPTRNAASGFDVLISDPAKVAAASPARADVSTAPPNVGTGTAKLTNVAAGFGLLPSQITATWNSTTNRYDFTDNTGAPLAPQPAPVANGAATDYTIGGLTFSFSGTPSNGDKILLSNNSGAVSDNGNMLALAKLQTAKTINGVSSFNDAYAQLVNDVGSKAQAIDIQSTSQDSITTQIYNAQQSVSGVNMDEETVNMLKFQQLYQANAKVIQTASTIFDTLISIA
ncbi:MULTISPECIES: flagellar hook-associated protein FlgK [unclassified Cupriavidus]|uniref:flagellar hook-associated protein FlgK n=1 Tax=Cupriavidus sp. H19C3 TaxID=3241603 RepID=UPI003BF7CAA8